MCNKIPQEWFVAWCHFPHFLISLLLHLHCPHWTMRRKQSGLSGYSRAGFCVLSLTGLVLIKVRASFVLLNTLPCFISKKYFIQAFLTIFWLSYRMRRESTTHYKTCMCFGIFQIITLCYNQKLRSELGKLLRNCEKNWPKYRHTKSDPPKV